MIVFLISDLLLFALLISGLMLGFLFRNSLQFQSVIYNIKRSKIGMASCVILGLYVLIALFDSMHFKRPVQVSVESQHVYYSQTKSLLDSFLSPWDRVSEKTYSKPFANRSYVQEIQTSQAQKPIMFYPKLKHVSANTDGILSEVLMGGLKGVGVWLALFLLWCVYIKWRYQVTIIDPIRYVLCGCSETAWRTFWLVMLICICLVTVLYDLSEHYHVFGTDKIGNDVFYAAIKAIRTAVIIGTVTTLVLLPIAIILGITAGYFGKFLDDVIQYIYTTLNSIPSILLIAALALLLNVFIENHPEWFDSAIQRADVRLVVLCFILGITSWTGLCRLLRAETLKVKQLEYIDAAKTLGVSHIGILARHILPNVMYLVVISVALDFSGLILAESLLSYVGIGVDPTMASWGNMINSARLELGRSPVVWWPLLSAFVLMFVLVLSANLFADVLRDALDPRLRK